MSIVFQSLVCMISLAATAEAVECDLWLTPTMANPSGKQTCTADGTAGTSKGKDCLKLHGSGMTSQTCDGSTGSFLCEAWGSPTTCCSIGGVGKIICSGGNGFTGAPSEDDFTSCTATCTAAGAGGSSGGSSKGSLTAAVLLVGMSVMLGLY